MRETLLLFIILFLSTVTFAQNKYATTTDGERVLLKADGTWASMYQLANQLQIPRLKLIAFHQGAAQRQPLKKLVPFLQGNQLVELISEGHVVGAII